MDSIEIKNRIKTYVEHADDRILRIFNAIVESQKEEEGLTAEHKEILNARLKCHKENPREGKPWEAVRKSLTDQYGL